MFRIVKEMMFEAAHFLPQHEGKCREVHGHHYVLQIGFAGPVDSWNGMVLDFDVLKRSICKPIEDALDHKLLNKVSWQGFPKDQPTVERMTLWLAQVIDDLCTSAQLPSVCFIRLYENPTSYAEWERSA